MQANRFKPWFAINRFILDRWAILQDLFCTKIWKIKIYIQNNNHYEKKERGRKKVRKASQICFYYTSQSPYYAEVPISHLIMKARDSN